MHVMVSVFVKQINIKQRTHRYRCTVQTVAFILLWCLQYSLSGHQMEINCSQKCADGGYCGPGLWNKLPADLRSVTSVLTVKNRLKSFCFHRPTLRCFFYYVLLYFIYIMLFCYRLGHYAHRVCL